MTVTTKKTTQTPSATGIQTDMLHSILKGGSATAEVVHDIFVEKYAKGDESRDDVFRRVAKALAQNEASDQHDRYETLFFDALQAGFMPGGRINSAAGTSISATLINCFVQPVGDSWSNTDEAGRPGIGQALIEAVETMRRGGGVGYNFSHIRPKGAKVKGTHSRSSGPVSFMRIFDKGCEVVESAGARRGAQMGVLRCDHPDIRTFIGSKDIRAELSRLDVSGLEWEAADRLRSKLRDLSKFNISVAVTHELIASARSGDDIELVHIAEPDPLEHPAAYQREDGLWVYGRVNASELLDEIVDYTYHTADPGIIFIDTVNDLNNLHYAETIEASNPCGEQMLPSYGCCCLGSVGVHRFVLDPFTENARIDWTALQLTARVGVRMLDNVLDVTLWPLEKQDLEAKAKRRIGLGFTGLGCAMAMLQVKYNSKAGVELAEKLMRSLCESSYEASVELAREKGAFPLFDAEQYLQGSFIKKLPKKLRDAIKTTGIRNSHLLSVAPTGTISMALGGNCSGGIEPNFANEFMRTKIMEDGSKKMFMLRPYSVLVYEALHGEVADVNSLPDYFVVTDDLGVEDHLNVQEVVQRWTDSAVSKTINCSADMPFDTFREVYLSAYDRGLKGCTTYRPNDVTGAVLTKIDASKADDPTDPDRRIRIEALPEAPLNSLRWPGRPELAAGNPSQTYMVEGGDLARFSVVIGHIENGEKTPFEVWVNGAEQPRGLGATAKLLSMDMRSNDRAWLQMKLDALIKTDGHPITVALMPDGKNVPYPSPTSVMTKLVKHRCEELGAFDGERPTPVLDALMSRKEPKSGPAGTMSWCVSVENPATGDDFEVFVKEVILPDGSRRPHSVWFSGNYPSDYDGLCKLLSIDMRVIDVAWIGEKLRKLISFVEPQGDFLARSAVGEAPRRYGSTLAYVADLILHRYVVLNLLTEDFKPVTPMGVLAHPDAPTSKDNVTDEDAMLRRQIKPGRQCHDCGAAAVVKVGGCDLCTACGAQGSCG